MSIILIISLPPEIKGLSRAIANCLENHVIPFVQGNISDILHRLNKWKYSSECFLSLVLLMGSKGMLMVDVISTAEVHTEHPGKEELGKTSIDEW